MLGPMTPPSAITPPPPAKTGEGKSLEPGKSYAERAQLLARLGVVGLRVGAGLVHDVEVEAAPALELGRDGELQDRLGAGFDLAQGRHARLAHHGGVHVGRRM